MLIRVAIALLVGLAAVGWLACAVGPAEGAEHPQPGEGPVSSGQSAPSARVETSAHASKAQGEVNLSPLDFKSDLAIWTAAVFLLLLGILWLFAWGPIADGLRKREQRIADEIASAERANAEARNLLQQYEERLAAASEEVQGMLQAARRDAEQVGHQIVEKAKAEAEAEHRRALGEIERAAANALKELAEQGATLAVELAGKIVRAQLDPQAHWHLIEQAMADFAKQPPSRN